MINMRQAPLEISSQESRNAAEVGCLELGILSGQIEDEERAEFNPRYYCSV